MRPLSGIRVVDFTLLLPGPLATLLLAQAGAEVTRILPPAGDPMLAVGPFRDGISIPHAWLAAEKRTMTADLNDPVDRARVQDQVRIADVVVEGFRPGVLHRFGLSYPDLVHERPDLIYCSISGHGQAGDKAARADHDLTYMAQAGLLDAVTDGDGNPPLPPTLVADIGAGVLPAALNIVLALQNRQRTGAGVHLDVSMTDNLAIFNLFAFAEAAAEGPSSPPNGRFYTGASPRYAIYRCADGRHLAVAALEDRFWRNFLRTVGVEDDQDDARLRTAITDAIAARPSTEWETAFDGADACTAIVRRSSEIAKRSTLPLPLHPGWRQSDRKEDPQ